MSGSDKMSNVVGIDWDGISIQEAKKRQKNIEKTENISTLLFRTQNGYHIKLFFDYEIIPSENFMIRETYKDCKKRLEYSKARYDATGSGYDILFNMKKGIWREML